MVPSDLQEEGKEEATLCGQPVTISQCKFQAYIARVNTVAEAQAVCKSVSEQTERDTAFSEFVCPFAYRIARAGGRRSEAQSDGSPAAAAAAAASPENGGDEEGYGDNGDVGSGEKLLYLLQKWDIRDRVLVVTRINGGFARAELLGVRRYRFVVDRAKKLLENSELASLRRAVDVDVNPPTTNESISTLAIHEGDDIDRHCCPTPQNSLQEGADATAGDGWDRFASRLHAHRRIVEHAGGESLLGTSPVSGSAMMGPWRTSASGSRGRGKLIGNANAKQAKQAQRTAKNMEGGGACWHNAEGSTGGRERQALSLAQVRISSKTVAFPSGHVPSVLGARGHGKKRGRINHFAVRTPPSTSGRGNGNGNGSSGDSGIVGQDKSAPDPNDDSDIGPPDASPLQVCATCAWILPHQLDPTSEITGLGASPCGEHASATKRGGKKEEAGVSRSSFETIVNSPSNPMLSRTSSCATINCPNRVSAIMLGMTTRISKDHTLHPPPPAAAASANRYNLRKGKRVPFALANPHNGADLSFAGSSIGSSFSCSDTSDEYSPIRVGLRGYRQQPTTGVVSGCYPKSGPQLRVSPHPPGGSGEATANATGYGTGAGGILHDGDLLKTCSPHPFPSGRCGGCGGGGGDGAGNTKGTSNHLGVSLPPLRQTPGAGVPDEPYHIAGGVATEAVLGSSASVGGWKNEDDRSISTTSGAESLDEPLHCRVPSGERTLPGEGEERRGQRNSPTWGLGDATTTGGTPAASGFSDLTVSRGESGLRGWTAERAVPASHHT